MIRVWLVLAALVLALAAWRLGDEARADAVEADLGQAFALPGGQTAAISGEPLRLRFAQVLEDSRCPTKVECFWTGQARIAIAVEDAEDSPTTVEFNTNPAPDQNRQTVQSGEFVIELQSLQPYPETPDDAIALQDYRATLLVRRSG